MVALLWEKQLSAISGQPSAAFSFQLSAISINKSATESDAPCTRAPPLPCPSSVLSSMIPENALLPRLLKNVQIQGGLPQPE
jgi:hypothetical protein